MTGITPAVRTDSRFLIDASYSINGISNVGGVPAGGFTFRHGSMPAGGAFPTLTFSGASAQVMNIDPNGFRCVGATSNGGGRATCDLFGATVGTVPIGRDFAGADPIPVNRIRGLYRCTQVVPVRASTRGAAVIQVGFCPDNGMLGFFGTNAAAVLQSDVGVNGGAWTPTYRLLNAGGITSGPSSGQVPGGTVWHRLAMRYTERLTGPLLEYIVDDDVVLALSGIASVPQSQPNPGFGGYRMFIGMSAVAGTTIQVADARVTVELVNDPE